MAGNLADEVRRTILARIRAGVYTTGQQLPPEDELAIQVGASRLTTREAVKMLAVQRVLRPVQGRGTYLNPIGDWLSIDAVIEVKGGDGADVMLQLLEVRSMIEVAAAALLAPRVMPEQLAELEAHLRDMEEGHASDAIDKVVAADLAFHQVILSGCGNPFVVAALEPIRVALVQARRQTSGRAIIRQHAILEHRNIIDALASRDAERARSAMQSHMDQTRDDTERYLQS